MYFYWLLSTRFPSRRSAGGLCAAGGRARAAFHDFFEAREVFFDLPLRVLAEEPRDERAELAARRVVLEVDADVGRAFARGLEVDAAGAGDLRAFERAPGDHLALLLVVNFGVPLDVL